MLRVAESNHGSAQRFATPDARTTCGTMKHQQEAMAERRLVLLQHSGKTPVLGNVRELPT